MLSRRNIRIKVMQMLYSMNRDEKLNLESALKQYRQSINRSFELYLFNLYVFSRIAAYAEKDAERKMAKLLPSEEDKRFTAKLYENELTQSIFKNEELVTVILFSVLYWPNHHLYCRLALSPTTML